jgi:hypothetical protein
MASGTYVPAYLSRQHLSAKAVAGDCGRVAGQERPRIRSWGAAERALTLPLRRLSPTELRGSGTAALSDSDRHPIRVAPP